MDHWYYSIHPPPHHHFTPPSRYVDASAANYRALNRFLRHHTAPSDGSAVELARRVRHLDALQGPALAEPLTLWRGMGSMAYVQHLREARWCMVVGRSTGGCQGARRSRRDSDLGEKICGLDGSSEG